MSTDTAPQAEPRPDPQTAPVKRGAIRAIETNGINVIAESERKGSSAGLFWPWCASNISVLAVSYGAFVLGFGIGLTQALVATVVGVVVSFFLVGLVSIAGKRGSAPTLVLSRAAFGRVGNGLPGLVSYLLLVGWETVLGDALHAGDGDGLRTPRLGVRRRHEGDRVRRGRLCDRGRRGPRLRRDHEDPAVAHDRSGHRHGRLRLPHRRRHRPRRRAGHPRRADDGASSAPPC